MFRMITPRRSRRRGRIVGLQGRIAPLEPVKNVWVKSSFSGTGDCVEWFIDESHVRLRDSKDPSGSELAFTHSEWKAFGLGINAGEGSL